MVLVAIEIVSSLRKGGLQHKLRFAQTHAVVVYYPCVNPGYKHLIQTISDRGKVIHGVFTLAKGYLVFFRLF